MENQISKEDILKLISASAIKKIKHILPDENEDSDDYRRYSVDGRDYCKWDILIIIMISGIVYDTGLIRIFHQCVSYLLAKGFQINHDLLNEAYEIVSTKCLVEIDAYRYAQNRFENSDDFYSIYQEVETLLTNNEK